MTQPVIFLGLNELNFNIAKRYAEETTQLPNFKKLFESHKICETESETDYDLLEPWIQWVSIQTGLSYKEHEVFRLGDIVQTNHPQYWEKIKDLGYRVGAISPMNAKNNLSNFDFFVPDPWTKTPASGSPLLKALSQAVSQTVNDNSNGRITLASAATLLFGLLVYSRIKNWKTYFQIALSSKGHPWRKAMFLDLFLSDIFFSLAKKKRTDFSTLFLNAAAHIQHHYLFSSSFYKGRQKNPEWYCPKGKDPILEVYRLYDRIIGETCESFPNAKILIATGLHQDPYDQISFYYRLVDHANFLNQLGVKNFAQVLPRMSRDFLVEFQSKEDALNAAKTIESAVSEHDNIPLFEVDVRDLDLFITLTYPHEIQKNFKVRFSDGQIKDFEKFVALVAIKNGHHNGRGFFADMSNSDTLPAKMKVEAIHNYIIEHFESRQHQSADQNKIDKIAS